MGINESKQYEMLEREKRLEKLKMEDEKLKFANFIKKTGKTKLSANELMKKPNKFKVFIVGLKRLFKRIFDTL